jgi:hypothetical protein
VRNLVKCEDLPGGTGQSITIEWSVAVGTGRYQVTCIDSSRVGESIGTGGT